MSRASTSAVTVNYATADGSATVGSDYTERSGTLTFDPGETSKTVSVPVLDDGHDEGHETFTLTLSNPTGGNAWLSDATANRHHQEHRYDAAGVAGAVRAHGGRAGDRGGRGPVLGAPRVRGRDDACRPADHDEAMTGCVPREGVA